MADVNVTDYLYPFDPTGIATTNLVAGEEQTLTPPTEPLTYHFIIPFAAPYFRDSLELIHVTTGLPLIRGTHWVPGHEFLGANYVLESEQGGLYASILFLDNTLAGKVKLTKYQTIGGEWTLDENTIFEIMANKARDPRQVTYDEVSGKPEVFPPSAHQHPASDMTGMKESVIASYDIATAIREQTQTWLTNPPILLTEYYTTREIDARFTTVDNTFVKYYTAVQVDQKLADLIADEGGGGTDPGSNYYTKAETNLLFQNFGNRFAAYDTSNVVDQKIKVVTDQLADLFTQEQAQDLEASLMTELDSDNADFVTTLSSIFLDSIGVINGIVDENGNPIN